MRLYYLERINIYPMTKFHGKCVVGVDEEVEFTFKKEDTDYAYCQNNQRYHKTRILQGTQLPTVNGIKSLDTTSMGKKTGGG